MKYKPNSGQALDELKAREELLVRAVQQKHDPAISSSVVPSQ